MSTNVFVYSEPSDKLDLATLAQCELQVDEFLGSPVSRNEPMLMGSPAAPTATAYSVDVEKVFCDGVLAIMRIASSKLFRFAEPLPFTGLESYFRARFSLSRAQVYRYLNCAAVISDLLCAPQHMTPMLRPLPLRQRVAKAVKDLAPCRTSRQQLWAAVLAQQPAGLDITSTDVQRVAALLQQEAVRGNHPHSLPPQVQPPSVTAVADTPCLAPTMVPKPAACRALAANYPSPPSETFHSMDDTDDHGDFSGMDAGHFGPGGDVSHDSQILYPDPTLPAAGGDEDVIPLVYPSPDIPHVTRVQDAVSPLHCLAHVAVTSSSFSPSMLSTKSDPTSEIPLSGPIPPTPNSGSLSQPALPHQLATAAPPTRISLISSSQAYRTTQASLRGPALGIMSPDLRPMTLRPESPVLGQSIAPSFGFDHAPACTNQWNCQLPPVRHLIAMVDQSTVKAQAPLIATRPKALLSIPALS